jgi:hypothetical protein
VSVADRVDFGAVKYNPGMAEVHAERFKLRYSPQLLIASKVFVSGGRKEFPV